jgi:hypothetical protein
MSNTLTRSNQPSVRKSVQQLERAERILESLAAAQYRSNRLTLVLGVASLLIVSGYFTLVYQRLSEHLEPEAVVDIAQNVLEERWPEAREAVEARIRASAPDWAVQLSLQTRVAIPQARLYLQNYALEKTDEVAVQAIQLSEDQFRDFVRSRRPLIQQTFQDLAQSPAHAEARLQELRKSFEEQLDSDIELQMKQVLHSAREMNEKLATLRAGGNLTPEQQLERRILMLARRLQVEQVK